MTHNKEVNTSSLSVIEKCKFLKYIKRDKLTIRSNLYNIPPNANTLDKIYEIQYMSNKPKFEMSSEYDTHVDSRYDTPIQSTSKTLIPKF